MKALILLTLFTSLIWPSLYAQDKDDAEARMHAEKFLMDHNELHIWDPKDSTAMRASYVFRTLESIHDDSVHIGIYFLRWMVCDAGRNYIMTIDYLHRDLHVYGEGKLIDNMIGLRSFLWHYPMLKDATKLSCYDEVLSNYDHQNMFQTIQMPERH